MKKRSIFTVLCVTLLMCFNVCFASEITLSDEKILLNGTEISNDNEDGIIYSNQMDNGSSEDVAKEANIKIDDVITITKGGEYTFSGSLSNGQIAVDANKIDGEVKIILDNVSINSNEAPAIFIYSKDLENDKCKVTIETAKDSANEIKGGRIKQSVLEFTKQDEIAYYIEKDYDDDGTYYERYKYDGAISSDISVTFDGEGVLNVFGNGKEGIEGKMHITVEGGTLVIKSVDDAINAANDGKSVITINDGMVVAYLTEEAEEGDGIDSNGSIVINGGTVYSFACPGADSGLDADGGTKINGGEVIATGSMNDTVTFANNINSARASFNTGINVDDVICVADENDNIIFAMKTDRVIQNFLYTSDKLENGKEYTVYTDANIEGTLNEWNIYTNITSSDTSNATKNEFNEMQRPGFMGEGFISQRNTENLKTIAIVLLIVGGILLITILAIDIKNKDSKMKILNLVLGILIGICLALGMMFLLSNDTHSLAPDMGGMQFQNSQNGGMGQMDFRNGRGNMKQFEGSMPGNPNQMNNNTI